MLINVHNGNFAEHFPTKFVDLYEMKMTQNYAIFIANKCQKVIIHRPLYFKFWAKTNIIVDQLNYPPFFIVCERSANEGEQIKKLTN